MQKRWMLITLMLLSYGMTWSQAIEEEIRRKQIGELEEHIYYPGGDDKLVLRQHRIYRYNPKKDVLLISEAEKIIKKITWLEDDSTVQKYTHTYDGQYPIHFVETQAKHRIYIEKKALPLEDKQGDYVIIEEVPEEGIIEEEEAVENKETLDWIMLKDLIPQTQVTAEGLLSIVIGVEDVHQGFKREVRGTYRIKSKDPSTYGLSYVVIKQYIEKDQYEESHYHYQESTQLLKLVQRTTYDKEGQILIRHSLNPRVANRNYYRKYSPYNNGKYTEVRTYLEPDRFIKWEKRQIKD